MKRKEKKTVFEETPLPVPPYPPKNPMDWPEIEPISAWWPVGNVAILLLHFLPLGTESSLQTPTLKPVEQVGFAPGFPAPGAACQ